MKKIYKALSLTAIMMALFSLSVFSQNAWINELHYDNASTDVDEFIEIVIQNPGSYSLADFSVHLYNGNDGLMYNTTALSSFTAGASSNGYTFYWYNYTLNGASIQNGAPDGMALSYQGNLISGQWLSYEGTMTANDGPAIGLTSVSIGVEEGSSTAAGQSLQLSGTGSTYAEFAWQAPADDTPGQLNNNQSLGGAPDPEPSNYPTAFASSVYKIDITLTWTDATGGQLPANYLVLLSDADNITAPADGVPVANDFDYSDGTGAVNVPYGNETCFFYPLLGETQYYFKIYPYTNGGANINYKTDGTAPSTSNTTVPVIQYEGFNSNSLGTWTSYSVASDKDWGIVNFGGAYSTTYFAQINGFNEDVPSNDWLISPSLNLDVFSSEVLEFFTIWKYGVDGEMTLKYSTNYTGGDPTAATWNSLSFASSTVEDVWTTSGDISLASITGSNVHIAFQYLSNGTPRRWGVDEIILTGGAAGPYISVTSPVTGDAWEQGTSHDITWTASNTLANVKIELTTNASGGTPTWTTLVASVPASAGTWTWLIPGDQTTSDDCQIRITDIAADAFGLSGIFSLIEPIVIPQLVITEIMYNPPESGTDSLEFVEIYNADDISVDLEGFYFGEGVEFTFPAYTLNPGGYFLVAVDSVIFEDFYGMPAWQFAGGLGNNGERISLYNNYDMLVDSLTYDDVAPWSNSPDGTGPSLTLCDPGLDNGLGASWSASVEFAGINAAGDTVFASPAAGCSAWPVAQFTSDLTVVQTGGSVTYTDESTGDPTEWAWQFPGGVPGSYNGQTPPPVFYNIPGEYSVVLVVSNAAGSSTEEKIDYIEVGNPPAADFSGNPLTLYEGETVDFTDLSTGTVSTWLWEFDGGVPATSALQNPVDIQYPNDGIYTVTLTVTNMFGSNVMVKEEYIDVMPVGIDEMIASSIRIYPNPSHGNFNLVNPFEEEMQVSVYSAFGQKIIEFTVTPGENVISLEDAAHGIYMVRFNNDEGRMIKSERLIIF